MRKIWIVVPFAKAQVARDLFLYVTKINEQCKDADAIEVMHIADKYSCKTYASITLRDRFDIHDETRLLCSVKRIEINSMEFPETPKAKINSQPTSY